MWEIRDGLENGKRLSSMHICARGGKIMFCQLPTADEEKLENLRKKLEGEERYSSRWLELLDKYHAIRDKISKKRK